MSKKSVGKEEVFLVIACLLVVTVSDDKIGYYVSF